MGWIISQAMVQHCENLRYSQGQVAGSLADTCCAGAQSAPSSGNPTQQAYLSPDKMKAFSRLSRSGMTCKLLTDGHGEALLMSYLGGFPAKTSASQVKAQALTANAQECGGTWHESSMKYDRDSHSWKTHQHLFDEVLPESSVILPKSGMTVDGVLWEQTTSARRTEEKESGYWPTPCLPGNGGSHGKAKLKQMLWLTPTVVQTDETPEAFQKRMEKYANGTKVANLTMQVKNPKFWPTPSASDNRDRGNIGSPATQRRKEKGKQIMLIQSVSTESGALNPDWVEWLMGWPIGWTDLKPLGTDKFLRWQQQRLDI